MELFEKGKVETLGANGWTQLANHPKLVIYYAFIDEIY